jgi:competence protein ComEC
MPQRRCLGGSAGAFRSFASGRDCLEAELAERAGFQWLAVAFAGGCLVYFSLPREPLFAALLLATAIAALVAVVSYRRGTPWRIAVLLAVCLAGATAAKFRVDRLYAPHIERDQYAELTARVADRENRTERRPRIVLDRLQSTDLSPEQAPRRVRVTLPERYGLPPLGATIGLSARLMPVAGPVVPGGYDPRRAAYFEGIGASGFALGGWQVIEEPGLSPDLVVARIRAAIVARIMAAEPGEAGAVAAALLVGERSALSTETNDSLRISGLFHILSISGLHMMLVAGTAFFLVRAHLALSPRLALTRPIRKWAAVAALLVVSLYFALSGGGAATVRAFVMAGVMFAAMLVDRPAISMRNLAIAAFIVLALEPEGIVEPGFQMSFGAVMALIAGWEVWRVRRSRLVMDDDALPGWRIARAFGRAVMGVALTTLIAGAATGVFAAYHFERVASYSLLGNLLAAPLVSAIIMPFGLLTLVLMPLGLEALPLSVMARGIEMLLWISDWVASLPGAEVTAPPIAPASLFLVAGGMLWLCLWRLRWRLLGLAPILVGLALVPLLVDLPDILIAPDGKAIAVRDEEGQLRVSGSRAGSYVVEQFFDEEPGEAPEAETLREGVRCDPAACLLQAAGEVSVAHVLDASAFPEDCRCADVIVTPLTAPDDCRAALVVDASRFEESGAHAVRVKVADDGPAFTIETERTAFSRSWQAGGDQPPAAEVELSISASVP